MRWGRLVRAGGLAVLAMALLGAATGGRPVAAPPATMEVLTTARPVAAGTVLVAADVAQRRVFADDALRGAVRRLSDVSGRRIVVGVGRGTLLSGVMFDARRGEGGSDTVVSLAIDGRQSAQLAVNDRVEVVAALPESGNAGNQVVTVAAGTVLAVGRGGGTDSGAGETAVVVVECSATDAMRALWAQAFARLLTVVPAVAPGAMPPVTSSIAGGP